MLIIQIYFYTHLVGVCPRHCGENGAFSVNALLFAIDYCTLKVNTITLYFATPFLISMRPQSEIFSPLWHR